MRDTLRPPFRWIRRLRSTSWTSCLLLPLLGAASACNGKNNGNPDTSPRWAELAAPVTGQMEQTPYAGAELFAGPAKFDGKYYAGVLPNGRIVKPAGQSVQIGMNPLGATVTTDGKYLITTNDDERGGGSASLQSALNVGGYSVSVVDTATMTVVSQTNTGTFFVGLVATGSGPYTLFASGGPDNSVKQFTITAAGAISAAPASKVTIAPIHPANQRYVNNYVPDAVFNTATNGSKPAAPSGFSRTAGAATTFPAGLALSPDGKYLYVACNGDNSLAVLDVSVNPPAVVKQLPVGFFPYGVSVSADGSQVYVSNWGVTDYKFKNPTYDPTTGKLTALGTTGANQADGFYVPKTDLTAGAPKTSSVFVVSIPGGDPTKATLKASQYVGKPLDDALQVGDTHPSATALVKSGASTVLYVAKANDDALALVASDGSSVANFDLSLAAAVGSYADARTPLRGTYPNAIAASSDGKRAYVAEAGINSVAVLDTTAPSAPVLLGRIPTGWYPTAVVLSPDNKTLFIINAKGIGEDLNPATVPAAGANPTGVESFSDGNYIFGTAQKVDVSGSAFDNTTVLSYNFAKQPNLDTSVVPAGGKRSRKIGHVIFILHENKTFDSMLGSVAQFGPFASTSFNNRDGSARADPQFTPVSINTQAIAKAFATAVNYYSDSEESDAGHQFCASGTSTDYTQKTLLVKSGRGLLVNKNFEPEDYPASGYIFNNAARNGVSFKNYGAFVRIAGTDTGGSTPVSLNDPTGQGAGYPANNSATTPNNVGDTTSAATGLGQSYFLELPVLAVLGGNNANGEARIDKNYPGYNFNISDQRRAAEFIKDFDRMVAANTVPDFIYLYQPNDHTGGQQATNVAAATGAQQVADGDVALGLVVQHLMKSPIYYDAASNTGAAIFITYDDAQSTSDHIHEHRTPLMVASPFAKPAYAAKRHYSTASIVKTEELLLGLPPNNLGDLFATDLRDLFQVDYNGVTASQLAFNAMASYQPSPAGRRIWKMVKELDTAAPDRDSHRLGMLARLSMAADRLYASAQAHRQLQAKEYRKSQDELFLLARHVVATPRRDADD
jgi:YVTN family beta-propeller protein